MQTCKLKYMYMYVALFYIGKERSHFDELEGRWLIHMVQNTLYVVCNLLYMYCNVMYVKQVIRSYVIYVYM